MGTNQFDWPVSVLAAKQRTVKKLSVNDIKIKRVYDPSDNTDGMRILVDRIWPRGMSKEKAAIEYWARDLAPSTELRKWYRHDPDKWDTFRQRYFSELDGNQSAVRQLVEFIGSNNATLLFSSREIKLNNACALKEYLISYQSSVY